jgi:3-phosphoshikimate 1-carboxyvinyltransferase
MTQLISGKSQLSGQVRMPGSKSHTIRAVTFASLARGRSEIRSPLDSLDAQSAVRCFRLLGAKIDIEAGDAKEPVWTVEGFGGEPRVPEDVVDVGNSGTSLRLALGAASLIKNGTVVFTGDHQIRRRPAGPLIKSLNELGAKVWSTRENNLAPYVVCGTLSGGETQMEAISSQYLSSLLINCPLAASESVIRLSLLNEKPYVEMTLAWLDRLGVRYENENFQRFRIPGGQSYSGFDCRVPADFSSATFFLCAAAMAGRDVKIVGLDMNDTQGDKAVVEYLRGMGAEIAVTDEAIIVSKKSLHGAEIDLNATPDALPAMAVTACFADGPTKLYNVPQARIKETDRIAVMAPELSKLGANIRELPDGLEIEPARLHGGRVEGHDDHRIVMAMSLAGLITDEPVVINGAEAAAVTFPDYVDLMRAIGAQMKIEE